MAKVTLVEYENECKSSYTLYIVSFSVFLTIRINIGTVLVCFYWYSKNEVLTNINPSTETVIY